MDDQDKTTSLGSLPGRVLATPGGGYSPAPAARAAVSETDSAQAVQQTTADIAAGLNDPNRDDTLIAGCTRLGNLVKLRVHPGTPLRDVAHPADADTQLVPVATFTAAALRQEPAAVELTSVEPADLERRTKQLQRARDLRDAFVPVVDTLDLIIRNLEGGVDTDVRAVYRNLASLIDHNPRFTERFGALKTWATRNGQRSAESRRKNALRDAQRVETAAGTEAPAPAATPAPAFVTTVAPAPLAPATRPVAAAAAAPAPRASRRRGRRG